MNRRQQHRGTWWRCATVWLVSTAVAAGLLAWLRPELAAVRLLGDGGPTPFETLLVSIAAVAAAGCATWLWLVTTLTTIEAARGRVRHHARGCPEAWRRLVLTACGVALASGLLVPAHADPVGPSQGDRGAARVQGLPLPDRPTSGRATPPLRTPPRTREVMVVRTGDSLWSLAAERLGPSATDAQVVDAWRRLYAANRTVVGADPDLVRPGQRLRVPVAGADR